MGLSRISIRGQKANKAGVRKWIKKQSAKAMRRTPATEIPSKARHGYYD